MHVRPPTSSNNNRLQFAGGNSEKLKRLEGALDILPLALLWLGLMVTTVWAGVLLSTGVCWNGPLTICLSWTIYQVHMHLLKLAPLAGHNCLDPRPVLWQ